MDNYRNLLLGCGHARDKRLEVSQTYLGCSQWRGRLETLDYESPCEPDIVCNLNTTPWPIDDGTYDEVHAYEVLEHLGQQGDYRGFFATFTEIWRILKPGGYLCATVPSVSSIWCWGDPGHTRAILPASLIFLDQETYRQQQGRTSMSDYRNVYCADLETLASYDNGVSHRFILKAIKPSRCQL